MLQIVHDGLLWISEGRNRKELAWKNKEISWHDLILRLSKAVTTSETLAEYLAFSKDIQAEKKDVGGFVGGLVRGGRRKAGSVSARYALTLDIEGPDVPPGQGSFWNDFCLTYGYAAYLYGTHKNSDDAPHLRLVMPLSREVFADEYQALGRKIAETLGIDLFDPTTFQPERLMYWGSVPRDVNYYTALQDGPWLDVDAVLGLYGPAGAWKDTSQWAIGKRANKAITAAALKQGDPLGKPGIIGAFNRTYTISEAIAKYLADVYLPTDDPGRYTYMGGTTASGLILYNNDTFAFSHHGTDPISGRLCNAFDLVRIHKFGKGDDEVKAGTPVNKYPSHIAMEFEAYEDTDVLKDVNETRLLKRNKDFDTEDEGNKKLIASLESNKQGIVSSINNVYLILQNDPNLKGCFAFNELDKKQSIMLDLPWRAMGHRGEAISEDDDACLRGYLEKNFNVSGAGKIDDAFRHIVMDNSYHPIHEYLSGLMWDKEPRLDTLFVDYLGAEDSAYTRAVTRKSLVAAIARIFQPGVKYDYVPVLVGPQGLGKSAFLSKLGGEWFSDSFTTVKGKEAYEALQGVWIMEIGELAGLRNAEMQTIKHFISKQRDRFRVAFGKRLEEFPRQCVFFGTTNDEEFLSDPTGNRRFWPIMCHQDRVHKNMWTDLSKFQIDQVWAEAICYYRNGEKLYLDGSVQIDASRVQESHVEYDEKFELIKQYLDQPLTNSEDDIMLENYHYRDKVSVAELWVEALGGRKADMKQFNTRPIHAIMGKMPGWVKLSAIRTEDYGRQRGYKRVIEPVNE